MIILIESRSSRIFIIVSFSSSIFGFLLFWQEKRIKEIKHIDFSKLIYYEQEDNTVGAKEYACVSGVCSIDDVLAEEAQKEKTEGPSES